MPAVFVSHGAPTLALDTEHGADFRRLVARADDDVIRFATRAPAARLAHPTHEHFAPLLVALGAGSDAAGITFPIEGFEYGSLSRLAVRFD